MDLVNKPIDHTWLPWLVRYQLFINWDYSSGRLKPAIKKSTASDAVLVLFPQMYRFRKKLLGARISVAHKNNKYSYLRLCFNYHFSQIQYNSTIPTK